MIAHLAAGLLGLVAVYFTVWFLYFFQTTVPLFDVFKGLDDPWAFAGGRIDPITLAWTIGFCLLVLLIGVFYLEGLELYLPRTAALALAALFGMGLTGFALECLGIAQGWFVRSTVALVLLGLLAILALRAWRRGHRPPETGAGGDTGPKEALLRRRLARPAWRRTLQRPTGLLPRSYSAMVMGLIAAITGLIFWHALLYPEVYYDSLILYLGYARQTFLERGFPVKVVGQVGIGLGANYPHMYSVLGSGAAALAGEWSELPQRLLAPLAGLAATILVYHATLRQTRHVNFALTVALLYRSIPMGIMWDQYATNYALAVLFVAGLLYLALLYIETGLSGYFAAATLLVGLGMHINYLMGVLWLPWGLMVLAAHLGRGPRPPTSATLQPAEAAWTALPARPGLLRFLVSGRFFWPFLVAVVIGSTWYVRNWIVTGNPIYAFFHEYLNGIHVNPDVMKAAAAEWEANGAGIRSLVSPEAFSSPIEAAWVFFVMWQHAYKTAPLLPAFAVGGLVVWVARVLAAPMTPSQPGRWAAGAVRTGWPVAALTVALLMYHFTIGHYYLYQIIIILPCMALLVAQAWPFWRLRPWRWVLAVLALWTALVPGLATALTGSKAVGMIHLHGGRRVPYFSLYALRHPLPTHEQMYRWRYGETVRMWQYINHNLKGEKLLTHENRHLVFDPSIQLVHLDDWAMQELWKVEDPAERLRRVVEDHQIHYYLEVPNEQQCWTNRRMQTRYWKRMGLTERIFEAGDHRLYRLVPPQAPPTSDCAQPEPTSASPEDLEQSSTDED